MNETNSQLRSLVKGFLTGKWDISATAKVPEPDELLLDQNQGKTLDAAVMYADLAESTDLVSTYNPWFAAAVYESFLKCASMLIKVQGGEVVAYDGDRVMGLFVGANRAENACRAGLKLKWAVDEIVNKELSGLWDRHPEWKAKRYQVKYATGIDMSSIMAVRIGIRGDNDITWVGNAANRAAKLCGVRDSGPTIISHEVFQAIQSTNLLTQKNGGAVWTKGTAAAVADSSIYWSTAHIEF